MRSAPYAFSAWKGNESLVVVDGREFGPFKVAYQVALSENGEHHAFRAGSEGKVSVYVDGKEIGVYENVASLALSPDGTHFGFAAKRGKRWVAVVDGNEVGEYDWILTLHLSADGAHHAVVGLDFVAVDGKKIGTYESPRGFALSSDGRHYGFAATVRRQWCVIVDGQEAAKLQQDDVRSITFSADFKQHLVVTGPAESSLVLKDARELGHFTNVESPVFSPDGKHYAFRSNKGSENALVVDGKGDFKKAVISDPVFLKDGSIRYSSYEPGKKLFLVTRRFK